jgi:hypothetical protein
MSKRTMFHHGPPTGILPLILEHIPHFNQWYAAQIVATADDDDDYYSDMVLTFGLAVEQHGESLLNPQTLAEARQVDALVAAFFVDFDNHLNILELAEESSNATRSYEDTLPWLFQHTPPPVHQLWTYLVNGRGLGRDNAVLPYSPRDPHGPESIGFWTLAEVEYLHTAFSPPFPLWTDDHAMYVRNVWLAVDAARARQTGLILISV